MAAKNKKLLRKEKIFVTKGQLRVIAGVLTNLAAGLFGSILIFPGLADISEEDFLIILTYSLGFGILSMIVASMVEDKINDR